MGEFELQRMKEDETIKKYSDKLLDIANKVWLLGTHFSDFEIVEKILVTIRERYEVFIVTLAEVLHALQTQELRRHMR
jgi:hypothetical protein